MDDLIKTATGRLEALIRVILPALFVLAALVYAGKFQWLKEFVGEKDSYWIILVCLIGSSLYFIHKSCLERQALRLVWILFENNKGIRKSFSEASEELYRERWARLVTTEPIPKVHQEKLNSHYDWLIASYCSAYGLVIVSFVIPQIPDVKSSTAEWSDLLTAPSIFPALNSWMFLVIDAIERTTYRSSAPDALVFLLGILALFCALAADYRITEIEWWLNEKFPQINPRSKGPTGSETWSRTI